jgi:PBP1b-binding outer membrane lipoprotein LpoB
MTKTIAAGILAIALLLTGCTHTTPVSTPSAPSQSSEATKEQQVFSSLYTIQVAIEATKVELGQHHLMDQSLKDKLNAVIALYNQAESAFEAYEIAKDEIHLANSLHLLTKLQTLFADLQVDLGKRNGQEETI